MFHSDMTSVDIQRYR